MEAMQWQLPYGYIKLNIFLAPLCLMSLSHASPSTSLTLFHTHDQLEACCVVKRGHSETGLTRRALCLKRDDLLIPSLVTHTHSCMYQCVWVYWRGLEVGAFPRRTVIVSECVLVLPLSSCMIVQKTVVSAHIDMRATATFVSSSNHSKTVLCISCLICKISIVLHAQNEDYPHSILKDDLSRSVTKNIGLLSNSCNVNCCNVHFVKKNKVRSRTIWFQQGKLQKHPNINQWYTLIVIAFTCTQTGIFLAGKEARAVVEDIFMCRFSNVIEQKRNSYTEIIMFMDQDQNADTNLRGE